MHRSSDRAPLSRTACLAALVVLAVCAFGALSCRQTRQSPHLDYASARGLRIPQPPARDRALVVFFRPDSLAWRMTLSLMHEEEWISALMSHSHFVYETEPGQHLFHAYVSGVGFNSLAASLEPGRIHFIAFREFRSAFGQPTYEFVAVEPGTDTWDELPEMFAQSDQVTPNASGRGWFDRHRDVLLRRLGPREDARPAAGFGVELEDLQWLDRVSARGSDSVGARASGRAKAGRHSHSIRAWVPTSPISLLPKKGSRWGPAFRSSATRARSAAERRRQQI